jgi:hypothetical protein
VLYWRLLYRVLQYSLVCVCVCDAVWSVEVVDVFSGRRSASHCGCCCHSLLKKTSCDKVDCMYIYIFFLIEGGWILLYRLLASCLPGSICFCSYVYVWDSFRSGSVESCCILERRAVIWWSNYLLTQRTWIKLQNGNIAGERTWNVCEAVKICRIVEVIM